MVNKEKICHLEKYGEKSVLSQFMLFCCKIRIVAIYAVYPLLCGEKLNQKLCLWRKKDKYQICYNVQ